MLDTFCGLNSVSWVGIQTLILFFTGLIVLFYTNETKKMRKTAEKQNDNLRKSLDISAEEFEISKRQCAFLLKKKAIIKLSRTNYYTKLDIDETNLVQFSVQNESDITDISDIEIAMSDKIIYVDGEVVNKDNSSLACCDRYSYDTPSRSTAADEYFAMSGFNLPKNYNIGSSSNIQVLSIARKSRFTFFLSFNKNSNDKEKICLKYLINNECITDTDAYVYDKKADVVYGTIH